MTDLEQEIRFFEANEAVFKEQHFQEWVIISGESVIGFFKDFQEAARHLMTAFSEGGVLLRQVGAPPVQVSRFVEFASV